MPTIKAREKEEDYSPIIFEVDGESFELPKKIDTKLMSRVYELDRDVLVKPANETVENNLRQLAIFAGEKEDYFVKKGTDLRDARFIAEEVMKAITERGIEKKKTK
jgi:hypothetical protein